MSTPRMFQLQPANRGYPRAAAPLSVPWSVADKAYGVYASRYGRSQSLERLAERGGFAVEEMDEFYPPWREEVDEIAALRAALALVLPFAHPEIHRGPDTPAWVEAIAAAERVLAKVEGHEP
jgi:hypothetical protein